MHHIASVTSRTGVCHAGMQRVAEMRARGLGAANASLGSSALAGGSTSGGGSSDLVSEARHYVGGNPTGRGSLWCARFMNMVLQHTGHRGTGSDMASLFHPLRPACVGPAGRCNRGDGPARRRRHVGIITGIDASGNPIMISGNNGNRVKEAPISRGRIYAYVMPN